jgi:hypothetical protein
MQCTTLTLIISNTVKQMLILNYVLSLIYISCHFSPWVLISRPMSPLPLPLLIAFHLHKQTSSYIPFNLGYFLQMIFPQLRLILYARVHKLLRSVTLLLVSIFLTAIYSFVFRHSSSEATRRRHYQLHVHDHRSTDKIGIQSILQTPLTYSP